MTRGHRIQVDAEDMSLSERIYLARTSRGWSQKKLAEKAGLSVSGVQMIEGEYKKDPRAYSIGRLARALNLSLDYLWYGRGV